MLAYLEKKYIYCFFTLLNAVKYIDKNLSGKSDEREVKLCKNRVFALHSSFFILRKLRFLTLIPYLWRGQR